MPVLVMLQQEHFKALLPEPRLDLEQALLLVQLLVVHLVDLDMPRVMD